MLVIGHRGVRGIRPENTISAFEYAIDAGADGIEFDVALTKDDGLVISHDPPPPDAHLPSLDEVFTLAPRGRFVFLVELKSFDDRQERFAGLVLSAIRRHRLETRVIVHSFDFRMLGAMKGLAPEIRLSALYAGLPRSFVEIAKEAGGVPIVAPQYRLVTRGQVARAHRAGVEVLAWTVNKPKSWARLAAAGVDGIITDDPAALIAWRKRVSPSRDR